MEQFDTYDLLCFLAKQDHSSQNAAFAKQIACTCNELSVFEKAQIPHPSLEADKVFAVPV